MVNTEATAHSRQRRALCRTVAIAVTLVVAAGCGEDDSTGPNTTPTPEAQLTFLRPAAGAPALLTSDTSFVATRGEEAEIRLFYAAPDGQSEGEEFLRLKIDEESLLTYPDDHPRAGAAFLAGDTITIRIQVDPDHLIATLEPSGLLFAPDRPAELKMRYVEADGDIDEDGEDDPELEGEIDLWRQERPGDPWFRIGELKDADLDEVSARLFGFSRYALAI